MLGKTLDHEALKKLPCRVQHAHPVPNIFLILEVKQILLLVLFSEKTAGIRHSSFKLTNSFTALHISAMVGKYLRVCAVKEGTFRT